MHSLNVSHFYAGEEQQSLSSKRFESVNPASGTKYAMVEYGTDDDVSAAVENAHSTFVSGIWSKRPPAERAQALRKLAADIELRINFLAMMEMRDCGKPMVNARRDVMRASSLVSYFSSLPEQALGSVYADDPGYHSYSTREPYGVVASILPWNLPFLFAVWKSIPALALGNSVVLKPSEETPVTAIEFAKLCLLAGIPAGVVNVVQGDGVTGEVLVQHPLVKKITFTGSTAVGRKILSSTAGQVKGAHLELGGKTANIVFNDADIDAAVDGALFSSFWNTGQICTSGTRLLLQQEIAPAFLSKLEQRLKKTVTVGDPARAETQVGPLVSKRQYDKVREYIDLGVSEGATLKFGGDAPVIAGCESGYFLNPTLFTDVTSDMRIAQEEIFGPITCVLTFKTEQDAVDIANDTEFGLAATIWTSDLARSRRLSENLNAGILWTNCINRIRWNIPYEGHGLSGMGEDLGTECIRTFTKLKTNQVNVSGVTNVAFPVAM
ncbi:aldehyde dehydrogenase family protein [Roseibium sediminicola]|uniref:Aldehyde dehydrogenase family protein n=1 Tax=Roseibium sediminicola TaxID=2933272 RepID=A0ABT0H3R0_9HYPH|nr:aldehyde dehydrogenase family protein [Roseibium sp. CAU 1639]MCK7615718.1 aldehyde dehydrogenase family protein [Roseibium sp. CAU 1639]